jgi:hypothetical protein
MFAVIKTKYRLPAVLALAWVGTAGTLSAADAAEAPWRVGLAQARITPKGPIRMAGYASRNKPSEGVLADLYAKAMAIEDAQGNRAVLLTADLIGFRRPLAEAICQGIEQKTGLKRPQILLNASHTHTGPVVGPIDPKQEGVPDDQRRHVEAYAKRLQAELPELAAAALSDLKPAKLSWGIGVANLVMNRREFTERHVQLGVNPRGYADRSVPVLRIDTPEGKLRAVVFGCACHNTTLTGEHYVLSGDYAGFAQQHVQQQHPGGGGYVPTPYPPTAVQAMFMIGCGADANPYPRGTVEAAKQHGAELGTEVCRVLGTELRPIGGPLRVELEYAELPLQPVPSRERLEEMNKGPSHIQYNAARMLEALKRNEPLPTHYRAPVAVWQFGQDLTLVALPGETVSEFVPLVERALGPRRLWVAGYSNDDFGYLVTAKIIAEGGYETRGLFEEVGFFSPQAQDVLLAKVRQLAEKAGRKLAQ